MPVVLHLIARVGWALSPYRLVGRHLPRQPGIILGAPHTSNWDFIAFLGVAWQERTRLRVLIKKSWTRGAAGPLIGWLGGIGVDRENPAGLVEELVELAGKGRDFQLVIAPEGTRSAGQHWKSGFYRIARQANLPVTLVGIDHARREVEIGPTMVLTGDIAADMDAIRAFYARFGGVKPRNRTEPRLRDEAELGSAEREGTADQGPALTE
ncbi:1-acyl-sn-glycerol-3-phosphate acyltransferase [Propionibacterium cyclohexanicum]|nr:1-acyl-sn-glycerol-3-phosphate acyltransferase [Propionibacterium cyclohexanicum]